MSDCVDTVSARTGETIEPFPPAGADNPLPTTIAVCAVWDTFVAVTEAAGPDLTTDSWLQAGQDLGPFPITGAPSGVVGPDSPFISQSESEIYVFDAAARRVRGPMSPRIGLFLGGGGTVGIAWEGGVLAGLADACGFDPTECAVIIGTSAGSVVGAFVAHGNDPHDILSTRGERSALRNLDPPDLTQGPFAEIVGLLLSPEGRTPEGVTKIGGLAINAPTAIAEADFVADFRRSLGTDDWPAPDLRVTTASCTTGQARVWNAADGIPLSRAVASSCAIPGFFPTVEFAGERYMDGSRGRDPHARIVEGLDLDAALFIGPKVPMPDLEAFVASDMAAVAANGARTHTILGSARLEETVDNLMDASKREIAYEIGLADAEHHAAAVRSLLES